MSWRLMDDSLAWLGVWDSVYPYIPGDVVIYKTVYGQYHAFVSKTSHNAGNIPVTSPVHWRRLYQEQYQ